eukprot:3935479-Rhodomonas_salina.6
MSGGSHAHCENKKTKTKNKNKNRKDLARRWPGIAGKRSSEGTQSYLEELPLFIDGEAWRRNQLENDLEPAAAHTRCSFQHRTPEPTLLQ